MLYNSLSAIPIVYLLTFQPECESDLPDGHGPAKIVRTLLLKGEVATDGRRGERYLEMRKIFRDFCIVVHNLNKVETRIYAPDSHYNIRRYLRYNFFSSTVKDISILGDSHNSICRDSSYRRWMTSCPNFNQPWVSGIEVYRFFYFNL